MDDDQAMAAHQATPMRVVDDGVKLAGKDVRLEPLVPYLALAADKLPLAHPVRTFDALSKLGIVVPLADD